MKSHISLASGLLILLFLLPSSSHAADVPALFIGNSYTGRHNLAQTVEAFVEANQSGLDLLPTTVIYGGRTLRDHWRLHTQNIVDIANLTEAKEKATIASLEKAVAADAKDTHAKSALKRHRELLANLEQSRKTWDLVILQSYRDDLEGADSLYHQFAPKFTKIAKAQGAKVILYETTPTTQNAEPLTSPHDPAPILEKARGIAALADQLDVAVAPMSLVALRCQEQRPDLTLRFINDGHLNQVLSYLTACTLYAAIFEQSPEGIPINSITDTRFFDKEDGTIDKTKDRNGDPITRTFSDKDRNQLQRIAWEAWKEFQSLRK